MNSFIIYVHMSVLSSPYLKPWPTYSIRAAAAYLLAAHALLHAARPSPNQPVALERLVILDVFRELAEGVARR
jgi:hypothetical protein